MISPPDGVDLGREASPFNAAVFQAFQITSRRVKKATLCYQDCRNREVSNVRYVTATPS